MSWRETEMILAKDGIKLSCKDKLKLADEEIGLWKNIHKTTELICRAQESRIAELESQLQVARECLKQYAECPFEIGVVVDGKHIKRPLAELACEALAKIGSK